MGSAMMGGAGGAAGMLGGMRRRRRRRRRLQSLSESQAQAQAQAGVQVRSSLHMSTVAVSRAQERLQARVGVHATAHVATGASAAARRTDTASASTSAVVATGFSSTGAEPFNDEDMRGMGSPELKPLSSSFSFPGQCFKLWRDVSLSVSAQLFADRVSDTFKACKCMCKCPYTSIEFMELENYCNGIINPDEYEFEPVDTLGMECRDKKNQDQAEFADEAEKSADEADESESTSGGGLRL